MNESELATLQAALDQARGARSFERFVRLAWGQVESNRLIWNWHMSAICEALEAVSLGQIRKLLVNVPPGMSKSLLVATFWPAWDWITTPPRKFIFAAYGQDLADKNARLHRDLVLGEWYQERWGEKVRIDAENAKRVREFHNAAKGWRISTSVGGRATGLHGDVLCFDDLVKAQDSEGRAIVDPVAIEKANDFWFKTMHTRRANPIETIHVGIMQRLHHEDASAKCVEKGDYYHLSLPMEYSRKTHCEIRIPALGDLPERTIKDERTEDGELLNPERFPASIVAGDKVAMGARAFEGQMNQNPTPPEGAIFKPSKLQIWIKLPKGIREIITVDCAFKDKKTSDFVAIQSWGVKNPNYYLIDQILGQFNVLLTMEMIAEMKDRRPRSVGIYVEDTANGPAVLQILSDTIPGLIAWSPRGASKISRAEAVAPLVESGNVFTPDPETVGWVQAYKTVMGRFPLVKHDDEVDATTMALLILHKPKHRRYRDAVRKMLQS